MHAAWQAEACLKLNTCCTRAWYDAAHSMCAYAEPHESNRSRAAWQVAEMANEADGDVKKFSRYTYPTMQKVQGSFTLDIEAGEFTDSEILVRSGGSASCWRSRKRLTGVRAQAWAQGPSVGTPPYMAIHGAVAPVHAPSLDCTMGTVHRIWHCYQQSHSTA